MKTTRSVLTLLLLLSIIAIFLPMISSPIQATDGTYYYDFIANAGEASWGSGAGNLPFPGSIDDSRGFACYRDNIRAEDGHTYARVLETHPQWVQGGYIVGRYPEVTVMPGTELYLSVGFLEGAEGTDGVTVQVDFRYQEGGTPIQSMVTIRDERYDRNLYHWHVYLDPYAGKTGQFQLVVKAGLSSGKDWAIWAKAEIRPIGVIITTDCPLPNATRGQSYRVQLEAVGGEVLPYAWAITDGSLPPGLSLNSATGIVSGTPTTTGIYPFRLRACDSNELDGPICSEPKDCYIQVNEPGVTPTPPPTFDFTLNVSPTEVTINLDPLVSGAAGSVESQTTATISLVSGIAQTVNLSLSDTPAYVSSYCLPRDGLPTFTSRCGFTVYTTGSLPAPGDYNITVTATGGGITRSQTITLHVVRALYGDLSLISVEPVQVVYGAPLVAGKATAFRVTVHSTFPNPIETNFRLELPEDEWDTGPPTTGRFFIGFPPDFPPDWSYPEFWGPVTINPGDNEIMLPIVPAGREDEGWDTSDPAGIIAGRCISGVCGPDVRVVPRPESVSVATCTVEVDPQRAIHETDERNNEYFGSAAVVTTKQFRVYFVITIGNAGENDLVYCRNFNCLDGCCSGPHTTATCAGGSRTHAELCAEIQQWAKEAVEYLLAVLPISDSKIQYEVDCTVRYEDDYDDYMGSMIALARENYYDYVLSVQPWGRCGLCGVGSAGCFVELYGDPPQAAHELAGHAIQGIGYECYAPSPDACPHCTEVSSSSCGTSEGFWVNEWMSYRSGNWGVQPPTYYMDGGGPTWARWQRLDNPWRHSDGGELPGGFGDLMTILEDEDDPQVLLIRGMVHKDGSAALGPCMLLENGTVDIEAGEEGDYYLVLIDSEERVLSKAGFDVSFYLMKPEGREELDKTSFVYRIEWLEETKRIELQDKDGNVLASREVSPNSPEIEVLYPNGGEVFAQGDKIRIRWQASDEDGDTLTYSLAMSMDGGEIWRPVDTDITNQEYELDTQVLEEGQNYVIRVRATDGVNTAEDVSDGAFIITKEGVPPAPEEMPPAPEEVPPAPEEVPPEGGIRTWIIIVIVLAVLGPVIYLVSRRRRAKGQV